jgi:hypothetical protein
VVRKSGLRIDSRVTSTVDGRFAVEIARTAWTKVFRLEGNDAPHLPR